MKRVTGIGGVFFSAKDPVALRAWYKTHLGIDVQEWGGTAFTWTDAAGNPTKGTTVWSIGAADGEYFAPSKSTFMINYRVDDLDGLLTQLREESDPYQRALAVATRKKYYHAKPPEADYDRVGAVLQSIGFKPE